MYFDLTRDYATLGAGTGRAGVCVLGPLLTAAGAAEGAEAAVPLVAVAAVDPAVEVFVTIFGGGWTYAMDLLT